MVYMRKLMEKCFSEKDLKYLDDKMPDFHLRKREDMKQKRMSGEITIDLDENQGTIHAVKTEAHLHIPMTSGNVIKIPLAAIQDSTPSHTINLTNEVNSSGMWQWITSESKSSLPSARGAETGGTFPNTDHSRFVVGDASSPHLATPEDDEEPITINIVKASPQNTIDASESQPLLQKRGVHKKPNDDESPV